jgi:hypothetical protein
MYILITYLLLLTMTMTNARSVLSSERAPHMGRTGARHQDGLTDRRSQRAFDLGRSLDLPPAFMLVSFLVYSTLKMEAIFPPKRQLIFNGLHGVISQKILIFVTTAVRPSNRACCSLSSTYFQYSYGL